MEREIKFRVWHKCIRVEDIITIYSDGVMHHLVYLKREI